MSLDFNDIYRASGLYLGGLKSVGGLLLFESFALPTV